MREQSQIMRFLPIVVIVIFVFALFAPLGWKFTGLMEEWRAYNIFERDTPDERGEPVGLITLSGIYRLRPLQGTLMVIAHEITADSFVGLHVVHMTSMLFKALAMYLLLGLLVPGNRLFALMGCLLLMVYPGDDGIITTRAYNGYFMVGCYLLAVYFMLRYWQEPRRRWLPMMFVTLVLCLFSYEIVYPLVAVTPAILLLRKPPNFEWRRFINLTLLWYAAPFLTSMYIVIGLATGPSYQSWVLQHSAVSQETVASQFARLLAQVARRQFADGWWRAFQIYDFETRFVPVTIFSALLLIVVSWYWARPDTHGAASQPRAYWLKLIAAGIIVIYAGWILYLGTPFREETWRVFLYSQVGGALAVTALVYLLVKMLHAPQVTFGLVMAGLISVSFLGMQHQRRYYEKFSETEQRMLRGVLTAVPQIDNAATLVVVDETGELRDNWTMGASYLAEAGLQYMYEDYHLDVALCRYDSETSNFATLPELQERCAFTADGLTLTEGDKVSAQYPYAKLVVVRYSGAATTLLATLPANYLPHGVTAADYAPLNFVDESAAPPQRYGTMFSIS